MQHEKNQILEQAFNADTNVDDLEGLLAKTQELQTKIQDNVTSVPFTKDKVVIPKNMLQMLFKSIKTLINRIFSILNMNHRLDVSNRSLIRENRHLREALDKSNGRLKVLEDNSTIPDLARS